MGYNQGSLLEEVDFEFGEDGSYREIIPESKNLISSEHGGAGFSRPDPRQPKNLGMGRDLLGSDQFIISQVQRDHAEGVDDPIEVSVLLHCEITTKLMCVQVWCWRS